MSQRTARLDELLRQEISGLISREIHDPRIGFVTVTEVEVTRDLSHATVWVSVLGTPEERRDAMRALRGAMPFLRGRLGVLRLRRIPELHVKHDDAAERGTRVLQILHELESEGGQAPSDDAVDDGLQRRSQPPSDQATATGAAGDGATPVDAASREGDS
ncbi:hypothetical protein BH20CHL6_BH20CHL6_02840 [soil metagenome]